LILTGNGSAHERLEFGDDVIPGQRIPGAAARHVDRFGFPAPVLEPKLKGERARELGAELDWQQTNDEGRFVELVQGLAARAGHMHDFLEKIGDLLMEAGAIEKPIRQVRMAYAGPNRRGKDRRKSRDRRETPMFAARDDYYMTEEEIAEYEQQEATERKKTYRPRTDLGSPDKNK